MAGPEGAGVHGHLWRVGIVAGVVIPVDSGLVGPDEGALHWLGGISARTLLSAASTGGGFSIVEHRLLSRELAAPLHRHSREDEFSVVTDGEVGFMLGDEVVMAGPGSLVRKPRNQWHTFFNAGDSEARLLELISPAGFEEFFVEIAAFFPADAPPDLEGMVSSVDRYGLEMDFDSLPVLMERFDLAGPPELE